MKGYLVICLDDGGERYVLATSRAFDSEAEANLYASTIHPDRRPIVAGVPAQTATASIRLPRQLRLRQPPAAAV